jgi:arginase
MILFFPQHQAGRIPSRIGLGAEHIREILNQRTDVYAVPIEDEKNYAYDSGEAFNHERVLRKQASAAYDIVQQNQPDFILTTGGDCGTAPVPIAYLNQKYDGKLAVLWIDAHADIHVPQTSPLGTFHGMP